MAEPETTHTLLKKILRICELFHGRYTQAEIRHLLLQHNDDQKTTVAFLLTSEPDTVRTAINGISRPEKTKEYIASVQSDQNIVNDVTQNLVQSRVRQFACEICDNVWWRKVPSRKQVSKCKICKKKYDPVPTCDEWGWATFECECGHSFAGWGQMNKTQSDCRACGLYVHPNNIQPPRRRRARRSRQTHHCDAPDCGGHHEDDSFDVTQDASNIHVQSGSEVQNVDDAKEFSFQEEIVYNRDTASANPQGNSENAAFDRNPGPNRRGQHTSPGSYRPVNRQRTTCISPLSRSGKKRVVCASRPHRSTGSTVDTWMSQGSLESLTSYVPSLPSVREMD